MGKDIDLRVVFVGDNIFELMIDDESANKIMQQAVSPDAIIAITVRNGARFVISMRNVLYIEMIEH